MIAAAGLPRELTTGPFRGSRAITAGLVTKQRLRGRSWQRLLPDVYVHRDRWDPDNRLQWCDAAALVLPRGGAVARLSALFLWGVDLLPRAAPVSLAVPLRHRIWPHPRLAPSRTVLPSADVTTFAGIPVTTPERTAFDLGRTHTRPHALVALDALCHRRLVTVSTLRQTLAQRPGWPGVQQLAGLLPLVEPLTESPMETRLRLLLLDGGAPPLTAQHDVRDGIGQLIGRVDLAYPHWRIAIEYEGDHHRERAQFRRDVARVNRLRSAGWLVLRFTADDVLRHPATVVAQVAQAVRERRHVR